MKKKFYENHIKLSLGVFFKNNKIEMSINEEEEIIKFGLIVNFQNKTPIFLHQSYA